MRSAVTSSSLLFLPRGQRKEFAHQRVDDFTVARQQRFLRDTVVSAGLEFAVFEQVRDECGDVPCVHLARVVGTVLARLIVPIIVTPCSTTISVGRVSSQLPPCSAARSTMTEPGAIFSTISRVISLGGFLPGTTAAEMTTSLSATTRPSSSRWRW